MALTAFMTITGNHQGLIKGDVIQKGYEFYIAVHQYRYEVVSPRDLASGLATGRVQHGPLVITKEIDIASVPLMQALTANENLKEVVIKFFRTIPAGVTSVCYQVRLLNASIIDITQDMLNNMFTENQRIPLMEKISFVYGKIEWTWFDEKSHLTLADDWEAPIV